jgi:hypothetical protein
MDESRSRAFEHFAWRRRPHTLKTENERGKKLSVVEPVLVFRRGLRRITHCPCLHELFLVRPNNTEPQASRLLQPNGDFVMKAKDNTTTY